MKELNLNTETSRLLIAN